MLAVSRLLSLQVTPIAAGLSVAAAAFMGKQAVQLYVKIAASPPSLKPFYKVGDAHIHTRTYTHKHTHTHTHTCTHVSAF